MYFYPLDFTFVCPTEIIAFSDRIAEFQEIGCEVRWLSVTQGRIHFPLYYFLDPLLHISLLNSDSHTFTLPIRIQISFVVSLLPRWFKIFTLIPYIQKEGGEWSAHIIYALKKIAIGAGYIYRLSLLPSGVDPAAEEAGRARRLKLSPRLRLQ